MLYFKQTMPNNSNISSSNNKSKRHMVMPYVQGLCESTKHICGIQTFVKGNKTIKNILLSPNNMDPRQYKSGIIYWYQCHRLDCKDEYIREPARTFSERYKEPLKAPSPIHGHHTTNGHLTIMGNFSIIGRDRHGLTGQSQSPYICKGK